MHKLNKKKKRFLILKSIKRHKHELERKRRRKIKKLNSLPEKVLTRKRKSYEHKKDKIVHTDCIADENFSLINNPDYIISYFEKARKSFKEKQYVNFDLGGVKTTGPETILLLSALINEPEFTNNIPFKGRSPLQADLQQMFRQVGFYNFVKSNELTQLTNKDLHGEIIHRITRKKVENQLAGDICKSAVKHTFKSDNYIHKTILPILIECMANTWNHANYGTSEDEYNWWLLAYKEPKTDCTKFCILDLGVGIFGSLNRKFAEGAITYIFPNKNLTNLKNIFKGNTRTRTKEEKRGKGLNTIYNLVKSDKTIQNFTIITNDVFAIIEQDKEDVYKKLKTPFKGTLYYWELRNNG